MLEVYRAKDAVEKAFYDLKNEQDAIRLSTHSAKAMDGKLFTLFISSILTSEIRKRMDGFNGQWTLNSIRTSLDKITFSKVKVEQTQARGSCWLPAEVQDEAEEAPHEGAEDGEEQVWEFTLAHAFKTLVL